MEEYDRPALRAALAEKLHFFAELDSTNERGLLIGREGAPHGSVVLAERQLAGRGRRGASWFCGEGSGLAFSVILRPDSGRALWPRLSLVAGMAVARALEGAGLSPEIKWPNDVLVAGRKVCGILVEAEGAFVVVGVGLNVGAAVLPEDLREVATTLAAVGAHEKKREEYLLEIRSEILASMRLVGQEFALLLERVRSRCALSGKEIEFLEGTRERRGFCEGIGEGGDLLIRVDGKLNRYFAIDQIRVVE